MGARAFARPGFPPPAPPLAFKGAVSPAFGLTLYGGVLTRLSRALGTPPDILSGVCRPPSRTAHPPLSPPGTPGVRGCGRKWVVFHCRIHAARRPRFIAPTYTMHPPSRTPTTGCSKAPQGLLAPPSGVPGLCTRRWVRRAPPGRDSGDLVDPFMHAGTYPARHLATLRGSELPPRPSAALRPVGPGFHVPPVARIQPPPYTPLRASGDLCFC